MRSLKRLLLLPTGQGRSPLVKFLPRFPAPFCISRREVHELKIHVSAVQFRPEPQKKPRQTRLF